ncbi:MAG: hypothetical protein HYZ47_00920 [Simkania negevensis]|nr:hypothetical protein [Simkania negevensis]
MKKFYLLLVLSALYLSGCYQVSSDGDHVKLMPETNNPKYLPAKQPMQPMTAMPY